MQKSTRLRVGAALLACAGTSLVARADVILDSFTERSGAVWPMTTTISDPTDLFTNTETGLSSVPGGQRAAGIGYSRMDVENFDSATGDIYNQAGYSFLDYHSTVGAAATLELGYGLGTPLNLGGVKAIQFNFLNYDLSQGGPLHISAAVTHGTDPTVYYDGLDVTAAGAQNLTLSLNGFPFNTVDSVVLNFTAPKGTDFRVDSITVVVPEPAALALLGLGLPLLLRRRGLGE